MTPIKGLARLKSGMTQKLIQVQALFGLIEWEPFIILGALIALNWIFYKFFLKEVSEERHRNIKNHFSILIKYYLFLSLFFLAFMSMKQLSTDFSAIEKILPYVGLITFAGGCIVFVKTCRLLVLQYLFMGSMRAGVPLLIVNIFSLALSIVILFWSVSRVFGLQLGPLLATSAAFSIILGLALQDTLGNLFAGISLQIDKSFEIDDWLEVVSGPQKAVGQVKEISWRSTVLLGFSDELITLPNRWMAQAQINNFSPPDQPIVRSQVFRLALGSATEKAIEVLEKSIAQIAGVRGLPAPFAYLQEVTENAIVIKIIYFIDSYGSQFAIGDKVLRKCLEGLLAAGFTLSKTRLEIDMLQTDMKDKTL